MNVTRFKQLFYAYLLGWKQRRILKYLQDAPKVREAIDYIKLRNDINDKAPTDLFSKQIVEKFPAMMKLFHDSYNDLVENTVWIKKPEQKQNKITQKSTKKSSNPKKPATKKLMTKTASTKPVVKASNKESTTSTKESTSSKNTIAGSNLSNAPKKKTMKTKVVNLPIESDILNQTVRIGEDSKRWATKSTVAATPSHVKAGRVKKSTALRKPKRMNQTLSGGFTVSKNQPQKSKLVKSNTITDIESYEQDFAIQDAPQMEKMPSIDLRTPYTGGTLDALKCSFDNRQRKKSLNDTARNSHVKNNLNGDNILSQSITNLNELQLTSLRERRSMNRGRKNHGLNRSVHYDSAIDLIPQKSEVVIEKIEELVEPELKENKFHTLCQLTKLFSNILGSIDSDENLQLECLEQCKRMIADKKNVKKRFIKPSKDVVKLRETFKAQLSTEEKAKAASVIQTAFEQNI